MTLQIFELNPKELILDAYPDKESHRFVLDHLVKFLGHSDVLPAVDVVVSQDGSVYVRRGHQYVVAAQYLSRPKIRAIIDDESSVAGVDRLKRVCRSVSPEEYEDRDPEATWHVFYVAMNGERLDVFKMRVCLEGLLNAIDGADLRELHFEASSGVFEVLVGPLGTGEAWAVRFVHSIQMLRDDQGKPLFRTYQGRLLI